MVDHVIFEEFSGTKNGIDTMCSATIFLSDRCSIEKEMID